MRNQRPGGGGEGINQGEERRREGKGREGKGMKRVVGRRGREEMGMKVKEDGIKRRGKVGKSERQEGEERDNPGKGEDREREGEEERGRRRRELERREERGNGGGDGG